MSLRILSIIRDVSPKTLTVSPTLKVFKNLVFSPVKVVDPSTFTNPIPIVDWLTWKLVVGSDVPIPTLSISVDGYKLFPSCVQ